MNRIETFFSRPAGDRRPVLSPFITAGFPSPDWTAELARAMADSGADMIEIGLPFSDPLADGPVIQASSQAALAAGMTVTGAIELAAEVRRRTDLMINLMSYYNPILSFGAGKFVKSAVEAGVDGLIVPDLPPDTSDDLYRAAGEAGLCPVYLVAPNTPAERVQMIDHDTRGFIYLVSVTGTTGVRPGLSAGLSSYLRRVRGEVRSPFLVGFGISSPEDAATVAGDADGVIIGSKIINLISGASSLKAACRELSGFISDCRKAIDGTGGAQN